MSRRNAIPRPAAAGAPRREALPVRLGCRRSPWIREIRRLAVLDRLRGATRENKGCAEMAGL